MIKDSSFLGYDVVSIGN